MIHRIKDFSQYKISEKYDYNETYFKLMPLAHYKEVEKNGYLSPIGSIKRDEKIYRGNWTIPLSNINAWLTPIKYFGSPLQALLMKKAAVESQVVLLHLKIGKNNIVHNRDITKMFFDYSFSGYFNSFSEEMEYPINESFIGGEIVDFELINTFKVENNLSKYFAEPQSVLDYVYGKGKPKYTDIKMTPIKRAMLSVVLKKIFTLDFS